MKVLGTLMVTLLPSIDEMNVFLNHVVKLALLSVNSNSPRTDCQSSWVFINDKQRRTFEKIRLKTVYGRYPPLERCKTMNILCMNCGYL